jgi:hypothetical protein
MNVDEEKKKDDEGQFYLSIFALYTSIVIHCKNIVQTRKIKIPHLFRL